MHIPLQFYQHIVYVSVCKTIKSCLKPKSVRFFSELLSQWVIRVGAAPLLHSYSSQQPGSDGACNITAKTRHKDEYWEVACIHKRSSYSCTVLR